MITTMKILMEAANLQSISILPSFFLSYSILLELELHCLDKDKEFSTFLCNILMHICECIYIMHSHNKAPHKIHLCLSILVAIFFPAFSFVLIHPTLIKMPVSFFISRFSLNSLHDLGFIKVLSPTT